MIELTENVCIRTSRDEKCNNIEMIKMIYKNITIDYTKILFLAKQYLSQNNIYYIFVLLYTHFSVNSNLYNKCL